MHERDAADVAAQLERLFALKPRGTKFGVDRMALLAAQLGHPERATPWIHVAGTNGKGSVSAMLDAILHAAGWRTGLFTSPHLVRMGERVQVDRVPLSDDEVLALVAELRPIADHDGDGAAAFCAAPV
jgi:dihydrofolate synthase/folylpolyglutamate synthase